MDSPQALGLKGQFSFTTQCSEPTPGHLLEGGVEAETICAAISVSKPNFSGGMWQSLSGKYLSGVTVLTDSFQ